MNEDNLWDWLRDVGLPTGHYSRIESPDTAPGFPDVHYQIAKGKCGTLELKCNMRPAKVPFPNEEKGLHRSQLKWIRSNLVCGGIVWIIAETPGVIYIVHGRDASKFNGATHEDLLYMTEETMSRDYPRHAATLLDLTLNQRRNDIHDDT